MASGDTKTEAMLNALGNGGSADEFRGCCNTKTQQYILDAIDRVQNVEDEVEELKNNPDVVDIVDTYADLEAYDTSTLTDKDIIRVLSDSTHSGNSTYYRWNATTSQFDFVGEIAGGGGGAKFIELTTADYNWNSSTGATGTPDCVALWLLPSGIYKGPADSSIEVRATKGQEYSMGAGYPCYVIVKECENTNTNRAIVTYVDAGNGNVVEYCNIDENGLNYTVKNFPNVVQTTGTSTTNVMSQNAVTSMVFADPNIKNRIRIGNGASDSIADNGVEIGHDTKALSTMSTAIGSDAKVQASSTYGIAIGMAEVKNSGSGIAIGEQATTSAYRGVSIGRYARASSSRGVAIGESAYANASASVALGSGSSAAAQGEMNIGTPLFTGTGYNNTDYRLLSGVHDPVNAHDAATKGYVDANAGGDTVYSDKSTSNASNGGAVYIGNLDSNQQEQPDPTTTDNHYRYFYALPYENPSSTVAPKNGSINILGECKGEGSVVLGFSAYDVGNTYYSIVIGQGAHATKNSATVMGLNAGVSAQNSIAIGRNAIVDDAQNQNSVALGSFARAARRGEVNIGTNGNNQGYNNTDYRVLGGVHDGQTDHDAVTVGQVNSVIDAINTALSTNIPHIGA